MSDWRGIEAETRQLLADLMALKDPEVTELAAVALRRAYAAGMRDTAHAVVRDEHRAIRNGLLEKWAVGELMRADAIERGEVTP